MKQKPNRLNLSVVSIRRFWHFAHLFLGLGALEVFGETNTAATLSSGGKATSANYSDEATVGDIVGVSTGPSAGVSMKSGFIGQLYEARSLAVSATPAAVLESGTTQLSAVATMHDDSLVRLGGIHIGATLDEQSDRC